MHKYSLIATNAHVRLHVVTSLLVAALLVPSTSSRETPGTTLGDVAMDVLQIEIEGKRGGGVARLFKERYIYGSYGICMCELKIVRNSQLRLVSIKNIDLVKWIEEKEKEGGQAGQGTVINPLGLRDGPNQAGSEIKRGGQRNSKLMTVGPADQPLTEIDGVKRDVS